MYLGTLFGCVNSGNKALMQRWGPSRLLLDNEIGRRRNAALPQPACSLAGWSSMLLLKLVTRDPGAA